MTLDISRFVEVEEVQNGPRYRVGAGTKNAGQEGRVIAVIRLRHNPGYEVVLHLDNGKQESFSPMQLFPA